MHQLANAKLRVTVSVAGGLQAIENFLADEAYACAADAFALETDGGLFSSSETEPARVTAAPGRLTCHFAFDAPSGALRVDWTYRLAPESGFFRRSLTVHNAAPLRLLSVHMGPTRFDCAAEETIHYLTFWMAPTVEFIRFRRGGIFTGIENPFYRAALTQSSVELSYAPALILQAREGYASESQFVGVYRKSGVLVADSGRPFRYPNGSAHIPIDRNESRGMRAYAQDYLAPAQDRFRNINYQFFHPLPQMPSTAADEWYFRRTIDTFAAIGGDMFIFKPLHRHRKPDAATPYWNVLPEEADAVARRITDYARAQGIACGFYLGIAGGHGAEGNAAGLPFRPEMAAWKKCDAAGRRAPDNCIGCDDFFAWWLAVQDNTIKRYGLRNWSWDPSLGSAMNCYDEAHGHLGGEGAYKGWRRCIELMAQLKARNPGLFIQGFYGAKQFGLWGLKHVDQHEVYNEQTAIVCTHHTQISDDRQNADGLRFQNYWCMRFRFLPTVMGHGLAHRMSEGEFDPELIKAWDFCGWRYAVLAALAVSGTVVPAILPVDCDLVPGFADFYHKWSRWAQAHFDYVPYTEPFGEQVQPGCIDGYARIKGDHGFVFLFNGNPRPASITFEVGDEIGLAAPGRYELVELYPEEGRRVLDDGRRSVFALGDRVALTLPANECQVLELRRGAANETQEGPVVLGLMGRAALDNGLLALTEVWGPPGRRRPLGVRLPPAASVRAVTVNGAARPFVRAGDEIALDAPFGGEPYARALDVWTTPAGRRFSFPHHASQEQLHIRTSFRLPADVPALLEQARPRNWEEMDARIALRQGSGDVSYSYHNFVGSRPHRLWLVIPFTLQKPNAERFAADFSLQAAVNGVALGAALRQDPNGNSFYADITDLLRFGAAPEGDNTVELALRHLPPNEFMGPYLLYPPEPPTDRVLAGEAADISADPPVVYTRGLLDPLPPRWGPGAPQIVRACVAGNVTLTEPTELQVWVDRPPAALRQVLYTHSGFPWMGKVPLAHDPVRGCWVGEITPGARAAIQESEYLHVWAVGSEGLYSDYCPVKVGWEFRP